MYILIKLVKMSIPEQWNLSEIIPVFKNGDDSTLKTSAKSLTSTHHLEVKNSNSSRSKNHKVLTLPDMPSMDDINAETRQRQNSQYNHCYLELWTTMNMK